MRLPLLSILECPLLKKLMLVKWDFKFESPKNKTKGLKMRTAGFDSFKLSLCSKIRYSIGLEDENSIFWAIVVLLNDIKRIVEAIKFLNFKNLIARSNNFF